MKDRPGKTTLQAKLRCPSRLSNSLFVQDLRNLNELTISKIRLILSWGKRASILVESRHISRYFNSLCGPSIFFSESGISRVLKILWNLSKGLWASQLGDIETKKSPRGWRTFGMLYLCSAIQHTSDERESTFLDWICHQTLNVYRNSTYYSTWFYDRAIIWMLWA